jgi:hypothetical protein
LYLDFLSAKASAGFSAGLGIFILLVIQGLDSGLAAPYVFAPSIDSNSLPTKIDLPNNILWVAEFGNKKVGDQAPNLELAQHRTPKSIEASLESQVTQEDVV